MPLTRIKLGILQSSGQHSTEPNRLGEQAAFLIFMMFILWEQGLIVSDFPVNILVYLMRGHDERFANKDLLNK